MTSRYPENSVIRQPFGPVVLEKGAFTVPSLSHDVRKSSLSFTMRQLSAFATVNYICQTKCSVYEIDQNCDYQMIMSGENIDRAIYELGVNIKVSTVMNIFFYIRTCVSS